MLDANIAASHLESAGIDCCVQDQYITQNRPESIEAYGGVRLQVREEDTEQAVRVLKGYGYFKEEDEKQSEFAESVDKLTDKIPFLHQYPLQVKLLAIAFLILAIILIVFILKNPA